MSHIYSSGALLGIDDASNKNQVIAAVIGCGGKTAFIESLARECRHKKVLITPTTKIKPMDGKDIVLRATLPECIAHRPVNGVQCLGVLNETTGKLEALPPGLLAEITGQYDIILLEADGSRGLSCKGWLPDEPVIPRCCTHTVGIVTLNALGKAADESTVLRLPEFLSLTGLQEGDAITIQALSDMVCAVNGMFRYSAGKQSIFINQVQNGETAALAEKLLNKMKRENPGRFARLAYGSALENRWRPV